MVIVVFSETWAFSCGAPKASHWAIQSRWADVSSDQEPRISSGWQDVTQAPSRWRSQVSWQGRTTWYPHQPSLELYWKISQWMCPPTLLQMLAQPRRMSSISSILQPAKHVALCMRRHPRITDHTTFFSISCWRWRGTLISLQNQNLFRSLNWIQ